MRMDEPAAPPLRLETKRLVLRIGEPDEAPLAVRFYEENRDHLAPFDPARPPLFYEERFWRMQLRQNVDDFVGDRALRLFLFPRPGEDRVIGNLSFTNFVRGVGQYCTLGYSIAAGEEGKGLMYEALGAAIEFAFDSLHMHRIEANYLPHNVRSGRLLRRLGFVVEGYSRDYLQIAGHWEDHVRTALLNPRWRG
jgi:[ribosomal protein S5]-alanine N-acetyltransferase